MKAIWEHIKEITGNDSPEAATPHSMNGEVFIGPTHQISYGSQSGSFTEDEVLFWGTDVTYDGLNDTFAVGDYVTFTRASVIINGGKVLEDNGSTQMKVALEDITTALADGDTIDEVGGTAYATIDTTITNDDQPGGEGIILAWDDTGDEIWIQLIQGSAPGTTAQIKGRSSGATATPTTVAAKTVPKIFLGSYTGSLIGAYGIGIDPDDLTATDTVTPLVGATQTPPNNVTWTLSGVVSGDRILVMNKHASNNDFDFAEMTLATELTEATETIINVGSSNIPADAPTTGTLRVELDDGRYRRVAYTSHDGDDEFTIASSDWTDPDDASATNGVSISFLDLAATGTEHDFTIKYDADRTLWWRVRDGDEPIKTSEAQSSLTNVGGSAVATRISDA
jgi:hypothetical protein